MILAKFGMSNFSDLVFLGRVYIHFNWHKKSQSQLCHNSYHLPVPGNQKSRLLFHRTYHFNNSLGRRILDKKLPNHAILEKIWYVGGCTSLTIWQLCQFFALDGNQKCRLLFDRTYHFNNTWEGEYLIKNYPAMQIWQKFGMSQDISDNLMTLPIYSATSKPEIQVVIWQNLPF